MFTLWNWYVIESHENVILCLWYEIAIKVISKPLASKFAKQEQVKNNVSARFKSKIKQLSIDWKLLCLKKLSIS